jgi:protein-tyrosine phosphatase
MIITQMSFGISQITDRIFLGPYHAAQNLQYRNEYGITHVLNCTPDPLDGLQKLQVRQMNIHDGEAIPPDLVRFGVRSIDEAVKSGGKILVSCHAGISRSPSMVCAYLMYNGFSWDEALAFIRSKRPQVFPHPVIEHSVKKTLGQMITPETTLLGGCQNDAT